MGGGMPVRSMTRRSALALAGVAACALAACGTPAQGDGTATDNAPAGTGVATVSERPAAGAVARADASPVAAAFAAGNIGSVRLIGDSITDGYGCDGFGAHTDTVIYQGGEGVFFESAADFGSWANDFRAWAVAAGVAEGAFVNAGISGARMAWLANEPNAWLADADLIVVMLGTNDAAWSSIDEYEANARSALAAAAARCTHLVAVSPPNNWRDDGRGRFTMAEANDALTRVCNAAGYVHASAFDAVVPGNGTMNDDGIHPTTAGSHAIWQLVADQLGLV